MASRSTLRGRSTLGAMARHTAPDRSRIRTLVRFVLGSTTLVLAAIGLGFVLGLARPRKDAAGRVLDERQP